MRTTLDLDDDLMQVARQFARQRETTMGRVVSQLVRQAMESRGPAKIRNSVLLFTPKPRPKGLPLELFNQLRDSE